MGVYVDGTLAYVANGSALNTSISMSAGQHHTVVEEWDRCGGASYTTVNVSVGAPPSTTAVNVTSPVSGSTVQAPVHYAAKAQTSTCIGGVASMGVYDNNQLIYTTNASSLDTQVALSSGPHHTVVEEWDYCGGAAFKSVDVTVGTAHTAVNVTSPVPGATVQSPVHYVASATTATCAAGVSSMGVYVNNKLVYVVNGASLNTRLTLATGSQHTVVEEWDRCGGAAYATDDITVADSASPPTVKIATSPSTVTLGSSATLTVTASNATQVTVTGTDGSSHTLQAAGGTLSVTPTASTTYSVIAKGFSSNATASTLVTVKPPDAAMIDYPRYKGDVGGNGANTNEILLTPSNVNSQHFGSPWGFQVDGLMTAQPLYVHGLTLNGAVHNVVYAATNNDSLYAVDANTGTQLWKRSFLSAGVTAVDLSSSGTGVPTGIMSTPVIDLSTHTMYVVAWTSENNATYFPHRLHAIDILTGNDTLTPVTITDSAMPPLYEYQRPGLLLLNGTIYVGFGSVQDIPPYHGYLFAFDAKTLAQKAKWNDTPSGGEGGIWMAGAAPTADSAGNIYIASGNGTFDGVSNLGQSAVKLSPTLSVLDYFTPSDYNSQNINDVDLGSGSVIVVPDQPGAVKHELIICGKPTPIYVLNRDNMGKVGTSSDNVVQRYDGQLGGTGNIPDSGQPCYNSPALWNNTVYFAANGDQLKMFTISPTTGQLSFVTRGSTTYAWPGANPVVSSNGGKNGIVWTVETKSATLQANDATDVSKSLYTSHSMGNVNKWVPPTVANGYVYVAAFNWFVAYTNQ